MSITIDHACAVALSFGTLPLSTLASAMLQTDIKNVCENIHEFSTKILSKTIQKVFIILTMCCSHPWLFLLADNKHYYAHTDSPPPSHTHHYGLSSHQYGRHSQTDTVCCPTEGWQRINNKNNNNAPHRPTYTIHIFIHCIQTNKLVPNVTYAVFVIWKTAFLTLYTFCSQHGAVHIDHTISASCKKSRAGLI